MEGKIPVRQNLHDFFISARKFNKRWNAERIWIDQTCIDQEDLEERSHQVEQMGTLYSIADTTIIMPGLISEPNNCPAPSVTKDLYDRYRGSTASQAHMPPELFRDYWAIGRRPCYSRLTGLRYGSYERLHLLRGLHCFLRFQNMILAGSCEKSTV